MTLKLVGAALSLLLVSRFVEAEDSLLCATVIAVVGDELGGPTAASNMMSEVKQQWQRATGRVDTPTDIAWVLMDCVDAPSTTVAQAIQQAIQQEAESTRTSSK